MMEDELGLISSTF